MHLLKHIVGGIPSKLELYEGHQLGDKIKVVRLRDICYPRCPTVLIVLDKVLMSIGERGCCSRA